MKRLIRLTLPPDMKVNDSVVLFIYISDYPNQVYVIKCKDKRVSFLTLTEL